MTHELSSLVASGFGLEDAFAPTSCATPQVTDSLGVVIATTHPSQEKGTVHSTAVAARVWPAVHFSVNQELQRSISPTRATVGGEIARESAKYAGCDIPSNGRVRCKSMRCNLLTPDG